MHRSSSKTDPPEIAPKVVACPSSLCDTTIAKSGRTQNGARTTSGNSWRKEGSTLIDALDSLWVSIHGPMRELIRDGESGIATDEAAPNYLRRNGITYVPRALEHQVSDIDRRGALLRDTVHRVVTQCEQKA